ncbi:AAA family ATPase [Candidatus Woesearchaeota archaeon]|nr:AAA family ATPase [Candidatus Woesearchaeota archaeon]
MVYELKANPIIGVVGPDCSGKGTVAAYLRDQQRFECYSLSDMLREEADVRGLDRKTETLIALGRELRAEHGNSVLAQKALKKLKPNTRYAIESIRHPDEVRALRGKVKFTLVAVDAPLYDRWQRFNSRKREGEQISVEEFAERDRRAFYSPEEGGQQVGVCMTMAQHHIYNHAAVTAAELYSQVDKVLQRLERLGWDEYFLNIMDAVAKRGTCDRGMAGSGMVEERWGNVGSS